MVIELFFENQCAASYPVLSEAVLLISQGKAKLMRMLANNKVEGN